MALFLSFQWCLAIEVLCRVNALQILGSQPALAHSGIAGLSFSVHLLVHGTWHAFFNFLCPLGSQHGFNTMIMSGYSHVGIWVGYFSRLLRSSSICQWRDARICFYKGISVWQMVVFSRTWLHCQKICWGPGHGPNNSLKELIGSCYEGVTRSHSQSKEVKCFILPKCGSLEDRLGHHIQFRPKLYGVVVSLSVPKSTE